MADFYIAEVRNYKDDPTRSGRVKVRIYNQNNDEQQIKDEDLPWAVLGMPTNNASTFKVGQSPHGLRVGSRVLVTYSPMDYSKQYPIIISSLPRGDKPPQGGLSKNRQDARETSGGKLEHPGVDNPAHNTKENSENKAFKDGKTIYHNQVVLKQQKPKLDAEVKYANPPIHEEEGKNLSDVRENGAKNADKPTSASADSGQTDIPQIMQQVDPNRNAQVLPQLYQQMQSMSGIMMIGMGGGASGGGGNTGLPAVSIPSGIKYTIQDSFIGALAILVREYGFERVIEIFTTLFATENKELLNVSYRQIVIDSLSNLIKLALYFGPLNIPVSQYDDVVFGDLIPPTNKIVSQSEIPNLWRKAYYNLSVDPYPGYQEWFSTMTGDKLWVKKPDVYYHFSSANEETFYTSEKEIAEDLDIYFRNQTPQPTLTMSLLNDILDKQQVNIEENSFNNAVGNNSNNTSAQQGMLGGNLQQLLQGLQTDMLSKTVLTGNVSKGVQEYSKHMGITNQLFEIGSGALGGNSGGANSLSNMGGVNNIMTGFSSNSGGIGGVLNNSTGGSGLLGNFGGFGGNSNGGGGAAGSGFPTAGFGQYNGGNISDSGLNNTKTLLGLLGIS